MFLFEDARAAAEEIVPIVVARHRDAGVLTWALLYQMEEEVVAEVMATGEHTELAVNMLRAADVLGYPKDDRLASFEGHGITPIIMGELERAWRRVN